MPRGEERRVSLSFMVRSKQRWGSSPEPGRWRSRWHGIIWRQGAVGGSPWSRGGGREGLVRGWKRKLWDNFLTPSHLRNPTKFWDHSLWTKHAESLARPQVSAFLVRSLQSDRSLQTPMLQKFQDFQMNMYVARGAGFFWVRWLRLEHKVTNGGIHTRKLQESNNKGQFLVFLPKA